MSPPKVIVIGGGISGLTAAHELVDRGFTVELHEARDDFGGKARSQPVPGTGTGDRRDLPGEHGFRFYPRFYRHVTDQMSRIPAGDGRTVADFLRRAWILDQGCYHHKHAMTRRRIVNWSQRLRLAMIGALTLAAALHALGVGHGADDGASPLRRFIWVAFATVALPAWAAPFHVMLSLDDHERLAARSSHMASLLIGLADELRVIESASHLRDCVSEAERILDLESAEWAESLIDRRPEFTG